MRTTISSDIWHQFAVIRAMIVVAALITVTSEAQSTCINDGTTRICFEWSRPNPPQVDVDFRVTIQDHNPPIVELRTGDDGWVIYVQNTLDDSPADLALLTLDPSGGGENFVVTLANGSAPGAANVGSIDLTASNWAGWSSLAGGVIGGDLDNSLVLRRSSGAGGVLTGFLQVEGQTNGDVSIPVIDGQNGGYALLSGGIGANVDVDIGNLVNSGQFEFIIMCPVLQRSPLTT